MASSYSVSSSDIIRAGGTVTLTVNGNYHRIRTDYPVNISYDGSTRTNLNSDSETFLPNPPNVNYEITHSITTMVLTLPTGYGAGGVAQVRGFNGLCVIESSDADTRFAPVDPRLLPTHCFAAFFEDTGVTQADIVNSSHPVAFWEINGKLPSEFFLTAVTVAKRDNANNYGIANAGVPRFRLMDCTTMVTCFRTEGFDPFSANRHDLFTVAGVGAYTVPFPFTKIPLGAIFSPWAAETPTINFEFHENRTTMFQTQIMVSLTGAVRW